MQTRNIILGPTEIKYNQNKHLQGEGKCSKKNRKERKKMQTNHLGEYNTRSYRN